MAIIAGTHFGHYCFTFSHTNGTMAAAYHTSLAVHRTVRRKWQIRLEIFKKVGQHEPEEERVRGPM